MKGKKMRLEYKNEAENAFKFWEIRIEAKKKRATKISGFILGSGKIYSTTHNGFIIVSSATNGKTESLKKIGDTITASPIITDGSLYIFTNNSKLFGFN